MAGARPRGAGRRVARREPRAGSDIEYPLEVPLVDAYKGTTVTLALAGRTARPSRIEVKIPPGVRTGSRIRVAGKGGPGKRGRQGRRPVPGRHARAAIRASSCAVTTCYTKIRAPFTTLLLGGEAHVTTPDGRTLALTIPAHTQDGRSFRLRGQGMPRLGAVDRPRATSTPRSMPNCRPSLSERERELLEEFQRAGAGTAAGQAAR